ncbi:hypothetical protein CPB83DRAFT_871114 [Crepidotus variabilis]|uniref:Uncharacterized protein n=1 Tax=Crepidotus variabilis TaxID=179855 RepID=A0A9P6E9C2_9AGAR|nr:hypothetical protein CPB83DRAFT_871114 [Crepidotus variabilis]
MSTSSTKDALLKQFKLPGFGFPLEYSTPNTPYHLFPNALNTADMDSGSVKQQILTLRELSMLQFMSIITDKVDWHVNSEGIASKWKAEACEAKDSNMTKDMADYCIDELRHEASLYVAAAATGLPPPITTLPGDVVKSDTAVSFELKMALQVAVTTFENAIPTKFKDWHPGSHEMVWDLVHPSLFPLVYGRSRILPGGRSTTLLDCVQGCGEGVISAPQSRPEITPSGHGGHRSRRFTKELSDRAFSTKFQWLPCEVDISGEHARITTYINSLHPTKEEKLYKILEKLMDASIPLWNKTLAPLADKTFVRSRRINYDCVEYDPDPEEGSETEGPQQGDDEDEDDYWDRRQEWIRETRVVVQPEPNASFSPQSQPAHFNLRERYSKTGLQVIVKLANIQLTPDKPQYQGGSWHVEGQLNEHIVATSLYYYSSDNITISTLAFRQQGDTETIEMGVNYQQNHNEWLEDVFGCEQGSGVQEIGCVETGEGRLLTFPNILQHRVGEFELADPTKPGHRKIVAFFLVDPNIKVISTAHVPCQQQEWWWETVMERDKKHGNNAIVDKIPVELQDKILEDVDFPMSLEDAKALRLELMEERQAHVQVADLAFRIHSAFNLCEH